VTKDGTYKRSKYPAQLGYGAMVYVRQSIVKDASNYLSRAVTIAVRYSAVRRQFGGGEDKPEIQVIDYATQQSRLFPLLATVYAFRFTGEWMGWLYADILKRLAANDFSTLPEVHASTSGLKSICTSITADGIEECRKLCGGHGYHCNSGLPELYAVYVPACTYEGDNTVLLLQVAKFLVKTLSELGKRKPLGTAAYLGDVQRLASENSKISKGTDWLNNAAIIDAFQARAARMSGAVALQIGRAENLEAAFEEHSQDLVDAARAHCQLIIVEKFVEKLQTDIPGEGTKELLQVLCYVYALSLVSTHAGDFLSTLYLTSKQVALAKNQLRALFVKVRPNAVALVDAFDHSDHYLGSILGRYDGDVYSHLYEDTKKNPLNELPVTEGYESYLRPVLKSQVQLARL
jgi:acyl-CoA oxidase